MAPVDGERDGVVVLGAGPAGLAVAAALAEASVPVTVVDPDPQRPWPNNYGVWAHDVAGTDAEACLARRWDRPLVVSDKGGVRVIAGSYGQVDRNALKERLSDRLARAGGRLMRGSAVEVEGGARVLLAQGPPLSGALVVDTTGFSSRFLARPPGEPAVQTAYGILVEVDGHTWGEGEMALMDFRTAPVGGEGTPPTFLYALPLARDLVFVEETALACRPAVDFDLLRGRLERRLAHMGVELGEVHEVERCWIPMNAPLPAMPQPVVGFGAAAGFVHPATGYSLARSLRAAPDLALAVAAGLASGVSLPDLSRLAWKAAWPDRLLRSHHLATFGLGVLLDLDAGGLGTFMDRFFAMPPRHWRAYLSGMAGPGAIAEAMLHLGLHAPGHLQLHLLREAGRAPVSAVLPILHPALGVTGRLRAPERDGEQE